MLTTSESKEDEDDGTVWGGVYVGPATDIVHTGTAQEAALVRQASLRASRRGRTGAAGMPSPLIASREFTTTELHPSSSGCMQPLVPHLTLEVSRSTPSSSTDRIIENLSPKSNVVSVEQMTVAKTPTPTSIDSKTKNRRFNSPIGSLRKSLKHYNQPPSPQKEEPQVWGGVYVGGSECTLPSPSFNAQVVSPTNGSLSDRGPPSMENVDTQPSTFTNLRTSIRQKTHSFSRALKGGGGDGGSSRKNSLTRVSSGPPTVSIIPGTPIHDQQSKVISSSPPVVNASLNIPRPNDNPIARPTSPSVRLRSGKVKCETCKKKCSGDVLRVGEKFYHRDCFICKTCHKGLDQIGYFEFNGDYYCPEDYHKQHGSRCPICDKFVEGEVVMCMGRTYHQACFHCDRCRKPFPSGQKVTFTGREHLCQACLQVPNTKTKPGTISPRKLLPSPPPVPKSESQHQVPMEQDENIRPVSAGLPLHALIPGPPDGAGDASAIDGIPPLCAACGEMIQSGQVLLALDQQWHIWCFRCLNCDAVLQGEFMAKDGKPFCIRDYNAQFGVRCDECAHFIAGKVLQAGDYHFHPSCARCMRCAQTFGDGEEMFMQGDEIWHSRCNDLKPPDNIVHLPSSADTMSHSPGTPKHFSTPPRSPRASYAPKYTIDFGKHLAYMYLLPEPNQGYLRQPITPHPPQTPQFHTPSGKPVKIRKSKVSLLKTGMQRLAEQLDDQSPRPHSPYMNNEEPIEMAHFPGGMAPSADNVPPIEREDFPAPPFPYAVEEIKRRLSVSEPEDDDDIETEAEREKEKQKFIRADEQLKKFEKDSSIAHIIAVDLEEKSKQRPKSVDPRSSSRTASAKKQPHMRCRYDCAINASPSRYLNRPRPWERWEDKKMRANTAAVPYIQTPKPGYGLAPKSATLPGGQLENGFYGDMSFDDMDTTRSSYYSGRASTVLTEAGPMGYHTGNTRFGGTMNYDRYEPRVGSGVLRNSLPDMSKPPTIYTYTQLTTGNKKLPEDVDRCHLERHLGRDEFERLFDMTPIEFYKQPDWKRVNIKRRLRLF